MSNGVAGVASLEDVMFRLMDFTPGEKADNYDTMVMVSLVNLLGIISVMNKQLPAGPPVAGARSEESPAAGLLKMLLEDQTRQAAGGGGPGLNPALLLSLLGNQGQRPENALLMALLSSMMQPPPSAAPRPERNRQTPFSRPGSQKEPAENDHREASRQGGVLTWDRRLGKNQE